MSAIGLRRPSISERLHSVTLETPSDPVADGDGGYTVATWTVLARVFASIVPATARELERLIAGTVQATATHLVSIPWLDGVTTRTRVTFGSRTFQVTGLADPEERHVSLVLVCVEVVT